MLGNTLGRRTFLKRTGSVGATLAAGLASRQSSGAPAATKPNVLFVFSDQHRASALGCYPGGEGIQTPHFDAFAKEGLQLDAAVSNTPVCCPFRASLMTGKFGHHNGVVTNKIEPDPSKHEFFAETFRKAGYSCGYVGKWHLGNTKTNSGDPRRLGFDDYWYAGANNTDYYHYEYATGETEGIEGDCFYRPEVEVDLALEFIKKQHREKPWCLFLAWTPPHPPFVSPNRYLQHYVGEEFEMPPNVPEGIATEFCKRHLPDYFGMAEGLDVAFGRLMAELDTLGAADNTIVAYTSDHGEALGSHGLFGKRWPHSVSTNIPFLVRWPGRIAAGTRLSSPFGSHDIFPTLAGLAGVHAPSGLDGADFSSLFLGQPGAAGQEQSYLAMHHGYVPWPGWRGVRTERYLYARVETEPWVLFDLKNDPFELHNLVKDNPRLVKELDALTKDMMKDTGDTWRGEKEAGGDWQVWRPGGPKQLHQVCGGDYPGKQIPKRDNWPQSVIEGVGELGGQAPK